MRVLVNALSLGSLSGQHVLFGHLSQLAKWTATQHEFIVLVDERHSENARCALRFPNVRFTVAPSWAGHWAIRSAWEASRIPSLLKRSSIDRYFTPAGTILPRCSVPQISLAQNPWCLVPEIHRSVGEKTKAHLQRIAYRRAAISADLMVYNSHHIQGLYEKNARSGHLAPSVIANQGIHEETHQAAEEKRLSAERKPWRILSVSAMAHWKGAETVVSSVALLRARGVPAELVMVGPWPDDSYLQKIRNLIAEHQLESAITIAGKVSVGDLYDHYATARVFCLMSRCESFGIPAVEAQAFGTPVVGSSSCAMQEIGGDGGLFGLPGDVSHTTEMLQTLLTDETKWQITSECALNNAARYRWELCSRPLLKMFQE